MTNRELIAHLLTLPQNDRVLIQGGGHTFVAGKPIHREGVHVIESSTSKVTADWCTGGTCKHCRNDESAMESNVVLIRPFGEV
jgi:hypothetical protein